MQTYFIHPIYIFWLLFLPIVPIGYTVKTNGDEAIIKLWSTPYCQAHAARHMPGTARSVFRNTVTRRALVDLLLSCQQWWRMCAFNDPELDIIAVKP